MVANFITINIFDGDVCFIEIYYCRNFLNKFIFIKVDLTRKGNPVHERLLQQFDVRGVPTVVFIDPGGKERRDLRLVDFMPPGPFLLRMTEIRRSLTTNPSN